ncbi:MAG: diacylglycerol kinase family lipid kinase [Hymenobacteraceae bacterium]|nr:diacylglycerol kinase family lipid kinase [Hymenobacteraceae bacterium]MDX5396718.1 diacylglycerol kinase family lipid kinase [Hymenobacteraceae bacterium]MDX5442985.1 diacylglycerol kinase family lipid kinase [Hymenobacteraceae bacterium]MDX5512778.1 diacylglycerol kinase family lipid kinase [Hymenobacteraceae bacterium]
MNRLPKALFIINPTSGRRKQLDMQALIRQHIDPAQVQAEVVYTERAGHATELSAKAAADGYAVVVAVGGDGTVNEVARGLLHSDTALAIVPRGSGNGLARHLEVPLHIPRAIELINSHHTSKIDACRINGHPFFTTAGIGFDAYISSLFAGSTRRGFRTYVEIVLKEFFNYKPQAVSLQLNGEQVDSNCFVLTFANAAQYGNNAFIAPMADIQDGQLDVVLIKHVDVRKAFELSVSLLTKQIATSAHAQFYKTKSVHVQTEQPFLYHADGEFIGQGTSFDVEIDHLALKVVVPEPKK